MLPNRNQTMEKAQSAGKVISAFLSQVYLWMMVGIAISGITAYVVASSPNIIGYIVESRGLFFGLIIAQFAAVIALSGWVQRMSIPLASFMYAAYATLVGLTFSTIFLIYTMSSISSAFFITSFAFAGLSVFGYVTKRDLGPVGSFCMMGLFGLIGITLLGIFIPSMMSSSMQFALSVIGILVFSGLTAYDTQKIKYHALQYTSSDQARKGAIVCALMLYLDFINLFLNILRLFGDRR